MLNPDLNFDVGRVHASYLGQICPVRTNFTFTRIPRDTFGQGYSETVAYTPPVNPENTLAAVPFSSSLAKWDDLIERVAEPLDPAVLLFRQRQTTYIGKQIVEVSKGLLLDAKYKRSFQGKRRTQLEAEFGPDGSVWDEKTGVPGNVVDGDLTTFLALKLATENLVDPKSGELISNPQRLTNLAKREGIMLYRDQLRNGFFDLTTTKRMSSLLASGVVSDDQREPFFQSVANWELELAKASTQDSKKGDLYLTQPHLENSTFDLDGITTPDYLPYAGSALLSYMAELPDFIGDQREGDLSNLASHSQRFYTWSKDNLRYYIGTKIDLPEKAKFADAWKAIVQADPKEAARLVAINVDLNELAPQFQAVIDIYRRNPGLLNMGQGLLKGETPTLALLRLQSQEAGGRAPRKPFYFRTKHLTRTGQI